MLVNQFTSYYSLGFGSIEKGEILDKREITSSFVALGSRRIFLIRVSSSGY